MEEKEAKVKLEKLVKKLESIKGRHTELVSIYVPSGYNLVKMADQINQERSTAQNIKSKTVRKNVTSALEKISQHLKLYKKTPENGVAIFSGNISEKEGESDIELFAVEPPEPIQSRRYHCGQNFVLDPLKEMLREKEIYGLVVLDKSEASIGLIRGSKIETLKNLKSIVPGKSKKGGQSAQRFARVREGLLQDFLKEIGEVASHHFKKQRDLKGIIIGGPGPVKEQFVNEEYLQKSVHNKIIGTVDTSYSGEYGLRETMEKAEDLISQASIIREKKVLDRFFNQLIKEEGLATYGLESVMKALEMGAVETLIISEDLDQVRARLRCPQCGWKGEKIIEGGEKPDCPQCGSELKIKRKDLTEELTQMAEKVGSKVEFVSTGTQKGEQLKDMGGVGAILRFSTGQI